MKQTTFASMSFAAKRRRTRREKFLPEMELVAAWAKLIALIEPHYPKAGRRGRPPMPLEGLAKNAAQAFTLIGLTSLYLARRQLMGS